LQQKGNERIRPDADDVLYVPETLEVLCPLLVVIPLELFAYHAAVVRGCNVDQLRDLAKSVTGE
jgi:glutamine---fructose-6-phosphate transaminase (isomerizing)